MAAKAKKTTAQPVRKAETASKAKPQSSTQPKLVVSAQELEQRIRDRAYFIYLNRGACSSGCAKQDWLEAEKQIKRELGVR